MVLPPTWSLAVADVVRYAALRPWQPRLTLHAAPETLPKRIERLRAAWSGSRLADGTLCAKFNFAMLEASIEHVGEAGFDLDQTLGDVRHFEGCQ